VRRVSRAKLSFDREPLRSGCGRNLEIADGLSSVPTRGTAPKELRELGDR
jgi:hypothetical protein